MKSTFKLQQLKNLLFVKGIMALVLAAPCMASATTTIDIKDTDYSIPADAYFVSPDGNDTNTGKSVDSPWSATKALTSAPSNSTIVFRGGTYRNIKATINKKLTLQAYPHEKPWIKGSIEVQGWDAHGSIWRKDGWNYSFPRTEPQQSIDSNYPMAGNRDMVYIDGVSLKQVASIAEVVPGTFYVDSANKQLYIGNNPAGKTVEATALDVAITMWQGKVLGPADTVIRGLGFAHYADRALMVGAPRVTLENNTIVWNGIHGVRYGGENIATDGIVRGNIFSYNGLRGVAGDKAHRMLLEGNTISYNNVEHFAKTWSAAGIKFGLTDGLTWRNNTVEHNFATGMWIDASTTNATIVNNTVRNNDGIGIQLELAHKVIVAANILSNNPAGIMLADSSSVRMYNNTLSMSLKHITVKDSPRVNTHAEERAKGIGWITHDNILKNNIFSNTTGGVHLDASACDTKQQTQMIAAANSNAYYRTSSKTPPIVTKWSQGFGKCSPVGYISIAAFNSATGFEANALSVDNVVTNPFFVDEANGDYRLIQDSSAIGRGEPLPAEIADAIGLPSGVPVDLGALQSQVVLVQ